MKAKLLEMKVKIPGLLKKPNQCHAERSEASQTRMNKEILRFAKNDIDRKTAFFSDLILLFALALSVSFLYDAHGTDKESLSVAQQTEIANQPSADPHGHIERILERPPYKQWQLRELKTVEVEDEMDPLVKSILDAIDEFFAYLADLIAKLFSKIEPQEVPEIDSPVNVLEIIHLIGWVALAILLCVLALTLYRLIKEGKLRLKGVHVLSRERVREALETGDALAMDGMDWLREAERLAARRDFRSMYRALYLALLSGLHSAGKIDFRKSRTNWTYVSKYRGAEAEREVFASLTDTFDRAWYGFQEYELSYIDGVKRQVVTLLGSEARHE